MTLFPDNMSLFPDGNKVLVRVGLRRCFTCVQDAKTLKALLKELHKISENKLKQPQQLAKSIRQREFEEYLEDEYMTIVGDILGHNTTLEEVHLLGFLLENASYRSEVLSNLKSNSHDVRQEVYGILRNHHERARCTLRDWCPLSPSSLRRSLTG